MSKRTLPSLFLFASLGAAIAAASFAPSPVSAEETKDCKKYAKYPKLKAKCDGGTNTREAIKDQMQAWYKDAKKNGSEIGCTTCHVDKKAEKGFKLEGQALVDKWKEWEAKF
jgi:hypothetical protein